MNDRIKLAEAMFQRPQYAIDWMADFDPFTDANDCEALIKWLTEQGYTVVIQIWDTEALVDLETIDNRPNLKGNCDDYKQGVCELALKIIENKDNE